MATGTARRFETSRCLLVAVDNSTHGEVVRGELDSNAVTREDSDVVHPHLAADVSQDLKFAFVKLYAETGIGQVLEDYALNFDAFLFIALLLVLGPSSSHRSPLPMWLPYYDAVARALSRSGIDAT